MRFGLFSSAAPLAISDDSMFPDKKGKFQTMKPKPKRFCSIQFSRFFQYPSSYLIIIHFYSSKR